LVVWYLYRATKDPKYLEGTKEMVRSISMLKSECGYANVKNLVTMELDDRMESFLTETLKYLYVIFDEENFVNQVDFAPTTEAHLISQSFLVENQK
jgi:hypothetical protein